MNNRDYYRQHFGKHTPLFHLPWWLDAVCSEHWEVALVKEKDQLKAYYLYATRKDRLGNHLVMPSLTQFLGPYYELTSANIRERNNEEFELLEQLLKQLPEYSSFESRWYHPFQNWLPFHWKGFQQRTRYTYILSDISNPERLRENFSEKIQREINKAQKHFLVETSDDPEIFLKLLSKNFSGKGMKLPFERHILKDLLKASAENNAGRMLLAKNEEGKVAAGIFIAWDAITGYYIIGGKDDDFGNSGAMSLLLWNAFNELRNTVKSFDFEGSMIKGVENYFRSFGAEQKGYFEITKVNSSLIKMKSTVKSLLRRS